MSRTIEAVIVVWTILVLGALDQIARHLERIEVLLRDRLPPEPDDSDEDIEAMLDEQAKADAKSRSPWSSFRNEVDIWAGGLFGLACLAYLIWAVVLPVLRWLR